MKDPSLGAVILAGGMGRRMKSNKAFVEVLGRPLLLYVLEKAAEFAEDIVLAIGCKDSSEQFSLTVPRGVRVVKDTLEMKASLIGMLTGLEAVSTEYAAVLPVDAPLTNPDVIRLLFGKVKGFDAAIPMWPDEKTEPLHAVYRVTPTVMAIRSSLEAGRMRVIEMTEMLSVNFVPVEELRRLDPNLNCLLNINTPEDLRLVEKVLSGGGARA